MDDMRAHYDFDLMLLQQKHAIPDGWAIYKWEIANHGTGNECLQVEGAVGRELKRGPRKGSTTWKGCDPKTKMTFQMSKAERAEFVQEWERKTGICGGCHGNGTTLAGWSAVNGYTYRECATCGGTGKAAS